MRRREGGGVICEKGSVWCKTHTHTHTHTHTQSAKPSCTPRVSQLSVHDPSRAPNSP